MDGEVVIGLRDLRYNPPEDMRGNRSRAGVQPASANALLSALCSFVKLQRRKFRLPREWQHPTVGVPLFKGGDGYRPWEQDEIDAFRDHWAIGSIQRAIFDTFLDTGQRGSDVWGMR